MMKRAAYGLAVLLAAGLASFELIILMGPYARGGEWEGLAVLWFVIGLPVGLVAAALSAIVVFGYYTRRRTWWGTGMVFLVNVILVGLLTLVAGPAVSFLPW